MVNSNKIFIAGGSGFSGYYFQKYIDEETTIHDLEEPGFSDSVNYIKGDVQNPEGLARAINGHEIILHLAAKHEDFGISRSEYMSANEGDAGVVVQASSKVGVKRIVFFSSVGVYGDREIGGHPG